ncbi:MAG: hypothetical protein LC687_05460 [Actinobacteria bacterium]|nr:hypothetical protein [Actinomycetota bacterium]MCA1807278.1 hypothetical protein [Actinomycetota bacterium]
MADVTIVMKKPVKGKKLLAGQYLFQDGKMKVNEQDAEKMMKILGRFYGCSIEKSGQTEQKTESETPAKPSVSKDQTKS